MKKIYLITGISIFIAMAIITLAFTVYDNLDYSQKYMFQLSYARSLLQDEHSKEVFDWAQDVFECRDISDKSKCASILSQEKIFPHNVNFIKKIKPHTTLIEGGVVPDAGAIKTIHKVINPDGRIIAFEPNIKNIESAKKVLEGYKGVEIYPYGLWKSNKTMKLWLNDEPRHSSVKKEWTSDFRGEKDDFVTAKFIKLDDFIKEKNIQKLDYLRLNIEGSELEALKGAKNTIKTFKPKMRIFIDYPEQLYSIILYLNSLNSGYKFWLDTNQGYSYTFCLYASVSD